MTSCPRASRITRARARPNAGDPVTQPASLPDDPAARGSQIHSNVTRFLQHLVEDTALSLRGPFPASTIADAVAGRARRSDPEVIASVFAAAVVMLAEQHNGDNELGKIDLPSLDMPDDANGTCDRAARFCLALDELMFGHGLILRSVLDVELYDPVKDLTVAQGLAYEEGRGRYGCHGVPPHQWQLPLGKGQM